MQAILNIQDPVMGSWHQFTVETSTKDQPESPYAIYLDGTILPVDFETHEAITRTLAAFNTDFAGIVDGLDTYLAEVWNKREVEARERKA